MDVLPAKTNPFHGIIPDPDALPVEPDVFRQCLRQSLDFWANEGYLIVMLEIPIDKSRLIPEAVAAGFAFHHSGDDYLMLTIQLTPGAFIPPFASHYVGVGGVVINDKQELLVVWEKEHRNSRPFYYKLPGGLLNVGEHIVDGAVREVLEETGIQTRFDALVCFRNWHVNRFGKSDLYFVCRLTPLTQEIVAQEVEIEEAIWMPVQAFLAHEHVGVFNKRVVETALSSSSLIPGWFTGYDVDRKTRELFLPPEYGRIPLS